MQLAMIFWKDCPDQIGSALVASLMFKKLAHEAKFAGKLHLADKLIVNAGLVGHLILRFVPHRTRCLIG